MGTIWNIVAAAADSAAEAAPSGGTQDAFDNALWQYPVAALVILIVIIFLRDRKKSDERHQQALEVVNERHEKFLTETNDLDRKDREAAQQRFTDSLEAVQNRGDNNSRVLVDTFTKTQEEQTKNQSALLARSIDTIDRNTEALGEVKALVQMVTGTGYRPVTQDDIDDYRDDSEDEESDEMEAPKPRKRTPRKRSTNKVVKKPAKKSTRSKKSDEE